MKSAESKILESNLALDSFHSHLNGLGNLHWGRIHHAKTEVFVIDTQRKPCLQARMKRSQRERRKPGKTPKDRCVRTERLLRRAHCCRGDESAKRGRLSLVRLCICFSARSDSVVKNPPAKAGDAADASWIPGLGRSSIEGNGNPLQYSCLENPMDRGSWQATVHGVAK